MESSEDVAGLILHASCVSAHGKAVLILGASGQGKSALALNLMALGADLVADDRTIIAVQDGTLWATAPRALAGLIEARGIGLLRAHPVETAQMHLIVDMDIIETDRLPVARERVIAGVPCRCLHKVDSPYFPAAILQYLKAGRRDS